jgi:hypothetical protein
MGYGVNQTWASLHGRARAAGSSKGKSTRTRKRRASGSVPRAPSRRKKTSRPKRRSLQSGSKDYHAEAVGPKPQEWGGSLAEWYAYRNDKTGTVPGKWL